MNKNQTVEKVIKLPKVNINSCLTLVDAFKNRKSTKSYTDREISTQDLSNILWCANGFNRPQTNMRTTPTALNWQEVEVYVIKTDGAYLYNPLEHQLELITTHDLRDATTYQDYIKKCPLNLVYVVDTDKMQTVAGKYKKIDEKDITFFSGTDCAFCAQNVYLYCAVSKIDCVVRASFRHKELAEKLLLKDNKRPCLAHTIGYQI
jgi:nitroreductase